MPPDTRRFGRVLVWLAIAILVAGGVVSVIAGDWTAVLMAAAPAALAALTLVVGRDGPQR